MLVKEIYLIETAYCLNFCKRFLTFIILIRQTYLFILNISRLDFISVWVKIELRFMKILISFSVASLNLNCLESWLTYVWLDIKNLFFYNFYCLPPPGSASTLACISYFFLLLYFIIYIQKQILFVKSISILIFIFRNSVRINSFIRWLVVLLKI